MRRKVLIICTGNSCRSQMAEALINHHLGMEWEAFSAGVNPSSVNPRAVHVMREISLDISSQRSKSVTEFSGRSDLDLVITVCDNARETCPVFPARVRQVHLGFEDPASATNEPDDIALPVFRRVRDDIQKRLLTMLREIE